jgi:hypothetical protein
MPLKNETPLDEPEQPPTLPYGRCQAVTSAQRRLLKNLAWHILVWGLLVAAFWMVYIPLTKFPTEFPWGPRGGCVISAGIARLGPFAWLFVRGPILCVGFVAVPAMVALALALSYPDKRVLRWLAYIAVALWFINGCMVPTTWL